MNNIMQKKISLLLIVTFILSIGLTYAQSEKTAQNSNFVLSFGPSVYYFQGEYPGTYEVYESSRVNFQVNGFIAYLSARSNRKNALGIFATGGYTNETTFLEMLDIQELQIDQLDINNFYTFYQIEAGMMAGNIFRFSTGLGRQNYTNNLGDSYLKYLSSSIGLMIDFGSIGWNIDANLNYGLDYKKTTLKISTGIMVMF